MRYTKEGTSVEISLTNGKGNAKILVKDYGEGVPEARKALVEVIGEAHR